MATQTIDVWDLTYGKPQIDPSDLAEAVCQQAGGTDLDYRTRLLIRDSVQALRSHWGDPRVDRWLEACPNRNRIEAIGREEFDKVGFPIIPRRLRDKTRPEVICQFLEQLGRSIEHDAHIHIAGAVALILPGYLSRQTSDIDIVTERQERRRFDTELLSQLKRSYGLVLAQVEAFLFPSGWQQRVNAIGVFGRLHVSLLNVYDICLSKLFSEGQKHLDDLRLVAPQLDKEILVQNLHRDAVDFAIMASPERLELAQHYWHVVFGEPLPL
jgi:hypothetical protein